MVGGMAARGDAVAVARYVRSVADLGAHRRARARSHLSWFGSAASIAAARHWQGARRFVGLMTASAGSRAVRYRRCEYCNATTCYCEAGYDDVRQG